MGPNIALPTARLLPRPRTSAAAPRRPRFRTRAALARHVTGIAAAVLLAGASLGSDIPPTAPVETLHRTLIEIMKTAPLKGGTPRAHSLALIVNEVFDIPLLARVALGRHWNGLDPRQRARMVDAVARYTVASYVARFDSYSGEHFETTGTRALKRGRFVVRTLLHPPGGETGPARLRRPAGARGLADCQRDRQRSKRARATTRGVRQAHGR